MQTPLLIMLLRPPVAAAAAAAAGIRESPSDSHMYSMTSISRMTSQSARELTNHTKPKSVSHLLAPTAVEVATLHNTAVWTTSELRHFSVD